MKECLDEGMLQSYFDGELSPREMESATLHLASCMTCSAAARELEQETSLLLAALAPEFEVNVPTARLRRRIDAAVAGLQVVPQVPQSGRARSFFGSLSGLFSFTPQRAVGFATLVLILALGGVLALVKFNRQTPIIKVPVIAENDTPTPAPISVKPEQNDRGAVDNTSPANKGNSSGVSQTPRIVRVHRSVTPEAPLPAPPERVKLLPGERSYLQTIARLDSTIKSDPKGMRPALQVEYERNLAVVDRAIAATRNAAKKNPNDPDAADFMFAAYQSKVDLLNTIADAGVGGRSH